MTRVIPSAEVIGIIEAVSRGRQNLEEWWAQYRSYGNN